ncbi:hypothetical protein KKA09_00490 [Patescibacteria group bacterium]|nr:hypothetical protein [Patescibacteria group bacterium]
MRGIFLRQTETYGGGEMKSYSDEKIMKFVLGSTGRDWAMEGWKNDDKRRKIVVPKTWNKTPMGKEEKEWEEILDNFDPARELLFSY